MHAPTGCWGVQTLPNSGQSVLLHFPWSTSPQRRARTAPSLDLRHLIFLPGIECRVFLPELHTGTGDRSKAPPLGIAGLHEPCHQRLGLDAALPGDHSRVGVHKEGFSLLETPRAAANAVSSSLAVKPATTPLTPSFTSSSQSLVPVMAFTWPGYRNTSALPFSA